MRIRRPQRVSRLLRCLATGAWIAGLSALIACPAPADVPVLDPLEPEEPEIDCTIEPELPADFVVMEGFGSGEDFDFDGAGHHGSVESGNLMLRTIDGEFEVFVPGLGQQTYGTRQLPSGEWVVASAALGTLTRVALSGGTEVLLSGLAYPNGVEVDEEGYVYVSENAGGRVRRVHAGTGEVTVVSDALENPNGIIESPDGQTLYVGTCPVMGTGGRGLIYALERTGPDGWAEPEIIYETEWEGCIDAINVDACGRLYFARYTNGWGQCTVWRLHLDTGEAELAADVSGKWVPNMRWGHDVGGWTSTTLYASDRMEEVLFAIDLGVPGKPHVLDP